MFNTTTYKLFISAVSAELAEYRTEVARVLKRKGLEFEIQENFNQGPGLLLEKLETYIKKCDAVIFIIGNQLGAIPSTEHLESFNAKLDYQSYLKKIEIPFLSYTQWEYVFAKKHNKKTSQR